MSDVFRQEYTQVTEENKAKVTALKAKAQELYDLIPQHDGIGIGTEASVAMIKLEEAVMWAVKGLTSSEFNQVEQCKE